ncbi:SHOCT domain-containing protein [Enterococcus sp. AZ109]|uniref:SHOCT domain-containing protein n=1 Tax=Enterococcus sp. AZ109 TaxID=2774634 RepID=UPI003F28197E
MKGETICWYCETPLKMINTIKLVDGKKVCADCHSIIKNDLGLNILNSKKITIEEINSRYAELGRDFESEFEDFRAKKADIKSAGIYMKANIDIVSGGGPAQVSGRTTIMQLNDNRIALNPKNPEFYYLLSTEFNGPTYKTVFDSHTSGDSNTDTEMDTVKKGKTGRVAAGAVIGTALFPGVGTLVGAYAGSKGKDKKKKKGSQKTQHDSRTNETTQEVEVKSLAKLNLLRISDNRKITLTINADTKDYNNLLSLQTHAPEAAPPVPVVAEPEEITELTKPIQSAVAELKELKELVDMGILTQEEFDKKKKELLNL